MRKVAAKITTFILWSKHISGVQYSKERIKNIVAKTIENELSSEAKKDKHHRVFIGIIQLPHNFFDDDVHSIYHEIIPL
jgi:hypothetical protein